MRSFKVGRGIERLLRPDKIMACFDEQPQPDAVVARLTDRLHGCPVQGVPFTADEGGDGLLSSGVDPPFDGTASSWRAGVTARLAAGRVPWRTCDRTVSTPSTGEPVANMFRPEAAT